MQYITIIISYLLSKLTNLTPFLILSVNNHNNNLYHILVNIIYFFLIMIPQWDKSDQ